MLIKISCLLFQHSICIMMKEKVMHHPSYQSFLLQPSTLFCCNQIILQQMDS